MAGHPLTFWLYGTLSIGAWLFVWFFVPETKGRSLEEIEAHWHWQTSAGNGRRITARMKSQRITQSPTHPPTWHRHRVKSEKSG
jgi:hypothetical protein